MDKATEAIVAVITAAFTVAIIAVIFSKNANTAGVLTSGGSALSSVITAAVSPLGTSAGSTVASNP